MWVIGRVGLRVSITDKKRPLFRKQGCTLLCVLKEYLLFQWKCCLYSNMMKIDFWYCTLNCWGTDLWWVEHEIFKILIILFVKQVHFQGLENFWYNVVTFDFLTAVLQKVKEVFCWFYWLHITELTISADDMVRWLWTSDPMKYWR